MHHHTQKRSSSKSPSKSPSKRNSTPRQEAISGHLNAKASSPKTPGPSPKTIKPTHLIVSNFFRRREEKDFEIAEKQKKGLYDRKKK